MYTYVCIRVYMFVDVRVYIIGSTKADFPCNINFFEAICLQVNKFTPGRQHFYTKGATKVGLTTSSHTHSTPNVHG